MNKSLEFHRSFPQGKIGINITKDVQNNLHLAYSPGVADPCLEINRDPNLAKDYTNIANSVAIISNGTAVLGLGKLTALASKPVMEGKSALFKLLAGIDCIDIEIEEHNTNRLVDVIHGISTSFGGINLEDIAAPECFEIENQLRKRCNIPIFHDDQHGTAIVSCAALINALEITNKSINNIKVVCIGAGAAGIACLDLISKLGVQNIALFDSRGVVHQNRIDCNQYKMRFAVESDISIQDALVDADVFLGTSVAGALKPEWIAKMAQNPLILALANPVPEILPDVAKSIRSDAIVCTGRSDYPNQVNNVLCFPYLFRVALDHNIIIDDKLKMVMCKTIADRARLSDGYGIDQLLPKAADELNRYIIPVELFANITNSTATTDYAKYVARRLAPHSHEILNMSNTFLSSTSKNIDILLNNWGYSQVSTKLIQNLDRIENGLHILVDNGKYFIVHSHAMSDIAHKLAKKLNIDMIFEGNLCNLNKNLVGSIVQSGSGLNYLHNTKTQLVDLALFSVICASIERGIS